MNENELQQRLDALPREARLDSIPPFRFEARPTRRPRSWLAAAAVLLVFAAGFTAGRWTPRPATPTSSDPVVEVQRTGTEYAAALARVPADEREHAYEVARSTLYGAATELSRLAPENPQVRITTEALSIEPNRPVDF